MGAANETLALVREDVDVPIEKQIKDRQRLRAELRRTTLWTGKSGN